MTNEEFYKDKLPMLKQLETYMLELTVEYLDSFKVPPAISPISSYHSRIKSADSMLKKLDARGFEVSLRSAMANVYDAVGVRIVCGFLDDVYQAAEWFEHNDKVEVIQKKDYIALPKPNGYRSLHLCLKIKDGEVAGMLAEVQIRTMALDFWASLEHQLKYKKEIRYERLIRNELKRCADEIAATDVSMQTIRDMLEKEF